MSFRKSGGSRSVKPKDGKQEAEKYEDQDE